MVMKAWTDYIVDDKKNKAAEEELRKAEERMKAIQAKQKEGSMSVMQKMLAATESGLVQSAFHEWKEVWEEEKRQAELEEAMGEKNRMLAVSEASLMLAVFHYWKRDTKVERMRRFGRDKNKKRKDQLIGVKGLFKNFAGELEAGLKEGTPRIDEKKLKAKHSQPTPK